MKGIGEKVRFVDRFMDPTTVRSLKSRNTSPRGNAIKKFMANILPCSTGVCQSTQFVFHARYIAMELVADDIAAGNARLSVVVVVLAGRFVGKGIHTTFV